MSKILKFTRKSLAVFLTFVMAFSITTGFAVKKVYAGNVSVSITNVTAYSAVATVTFTPSNSGEIASTASISGVGFNAQTAQLSGGNTTVTFNIYGLSANMIYTCEAAVNYTANGVWQNTSTTTQFTTPSENISLSLPTITYLSSQQLTFTSTFNGSSSAQFGFAYSASNTTPSVGVDSNINATVSGNIITASPPVNTGQTLYVRAYSLLNGTYTYSQTAVYNNSNIPAVNTTSIRSSTTTTGNVYAEANISSRGASNIIEYGFVYSTSTNPTINNTKEIVGSHDPGLVSYNRDFTPNISSSNATSVTIYVRPYVTNSQGTAYGTEQMLTVTVNNISVSLGTVSVLSATTANAQTTVSGVSVNNVYEWGVVYSTTNSNPTRTTSQNVSYALVPSGNSSATATVNITTGLVANTRYFIRAYARTANGNYVYSPTKEFTTPIDATVNILEVSGITHNAARVTGSLTSSAGSTSIKEKGFVYSRVNQTPTINDQVKKSSNNSVGEFSEELNFLMANSDYYVRAYVIIGNNQVVYSSAVRTFKTLNNSTSMSVIYMTENGQVVGEQNFTDRSIGDVMTFRSLVVPTGYRLQNENWMYTILGNETVNVYVVGTGAVQQPPTQTPTPTNPTQPPTQTVPPQVTPPANYREEPFMHGDGGYTFNPNRPVTVLEVAAMLFSLSADPNVTYHSPYWFPDVPHDNPFTMNIINFVSSQGYMIGNDLGLFRPDDTITRAEIATILCETEGYQQYYQGEFPIPPAFGDTIGHWAQGYIFLAARNGAFGGYEDGTFRPDNQITKAEIASVLNSVYGRSLNPMGTMDFIDVPREHWAYPYIMNAAIPMQ